MFHELVAPNPRSAAKLPAEKSGNEELAPLPWKVKQIAQEGSRDANSTSESDVRDFCDVLWAVMTFTI